MSLVDANERAHRIVDDALYAAAEALMVLDVAAARDGVARFVALLRAHLEVEEAQVAPRYAPHAPAEGAGALQHVASDHAILRKHLERLERTVHELPDEVSRRAALLALDPFLKAIATLDHHGERERRFVYATLEEKLEEDDKRAIAAALTP